MTFRKKEGKKEHEEMEGTIEKRRKKRFFGNPSEFVYHSIYLGRLIRFFHGDL